jgi:hypothetical protein
VGHDDETSRGGRTRAATDRHQQLIPRCALVEPAGTGRVHQRATAGGAQTPVTCSGRMGTRRSGRPQAARTAAATAGPEEMVGGSPTPRTP